MRQKLIAILTAIALCATPASIGLAEADMTVIAEAAIEATVEADATAFAAAESDFAATATAEVAVNDTTTAVDVESDLSVTATEAGLTAADAEVGVETAETLSAVAVDTGVKLSWPPITGAPGYYVYRSGDPEFVDYTITNQITATDYIDVKVDENTLYYYKYAAASPETVWKPPASAGAVAVTTKDVILGGGVSGLQAGVVKHFILMKVDDPYMSVDGIRQEIDPGRGTVPILNYNRTLVPIRAIIEAMDGTVGWDEETQKITLVANGHNVEMWLEKTDLLADGEAKTMDVAPTSINFRTMVPVRFAAENAGCVVDWLESTGEIVIVYDNTAAAAAPAITVPGTFAPEPPLNTDPNTATPAPPDNTAPDPAVPSPPANTAQYPAAPSVDLGSGPEIRTNYSAVELVKIMTDIELLIQDKPTSGRQISMSELDALQEPFLKQDNAGATTYYKNAFGEFVKRNNEWFAASTFDIMDDWYNDTAGRTETLYVKNEYARDNEGRVRCSIYTEDAGYINNYSWYKNETTGILWKFPKESSGNANQDTSRFYVMLYPDAVVAGQECIVYGYEAQDMSSYYWFSKTKGYIILDETFYSGGEIYANYTYDMYNMIKDNSFFNPENQGVTVWYEEN